MAQRPVEMILLRQAASALLTPIFLIDAEGSLLYFNEAAESLLGRRFDDVGEMTLADWLAAFEPRHPEGTSTDEEAPVVAALRSREPVHGPVAFRGLDGVTRLIEVTALPLVGHDDVLLGAMAIFWPRSDPAG